MVKGLGRILFEPDPFDLMAIDFKTVLDLAGNTMAVFNVIDHGRFDSYASISSKIGCHAP